MLVRMAASLLSLGLLLTGARVPAQEASPGRGGDTSSEPPRVLHFTKSPNAPVVPKLPTGNEAGVPPTAASSKAALRPVGMQVPSRDVITPQGEEDQTYQVQLEPPGPLRLFRLESEKALRERMRQEVRERTPPGLPPERLVFPEEPVITRQPYAGRAFPPGNLSVEPIYLCYGRLYFEQKNSERFGWDLGPLQPLLSATAFYWDLAMLPYHMATAPCQQYECSAGYCLPGDPVPFLLYPPELSVTGVLAEAGTVIALIAIFP
jgi:hypothetical protein